MTAFSCRLPCKPMGAITLMCYFGYIKKLAKKKATAHWLLEGDVASTSHLCCRRPIPDQAILLTLQPVISKIWGIMSASVLSSVAVPAASSPGFRLSKGILLRRVVVSLALNFAICVKASLGLDESTTTHTSAN